MLDENSINERIKVLDGDIAKVAEQMQSLEKQKSDAIAMMNALQGAKQQCQSFLNELNNDEPDVSDSDSSDVE
jgi:chromosome segregation ATPase|tara:strand:+ start:375 stop:593 length:219 start_codon:yes stop_codon:yes gene_type:complete